MIITHILDTAVPFIEAISRALPVAAVIGIPYSTMPSARAQLEMEGMRIIIPPDLESLPGIAHEEILRAAAESGQSVIVQEIGGYCAPLVAELHRSGHLAGVVEDTKQGHWRYTELSELHCPVLSIADSPLKALENQQVGRSISHALETILRRRFHRLLTETRIGVLGYGGIGEATARALSALGARVAAYDSCGIRMAKASLDGFGDLSREDLVSSSNVLLGTSGQCSIGADDIRQIRSGTILASGSSKQVEIDLAALDSLGSPQVKSRFETEYNFEDGRSIFLLNEGMPINFLEQSILGRVLDLVYTELFMCVREVALGEAEPGLSELDVAQHRAIAQTWRHLHWA